MQTELYYTPPNQALFDELKVACIELWKTYDDTYNYATNKVNQINSLYNISGNFMSMVSMFDIMNQITLSQNLSEECNTAIKDRMLSGGADSRYIVFK